MIAGGRTVSAFDPKGWQEGVLWVGESGIALIDRDDFRRRSAAKEALQSGPWLIRAGRVASTLENDMRRARRAFVGTSREGGCALGFSTAATFSELAEFLLQQPVEGFTFAEALALDGATSAGFWCDIEGTQVSEPELVTVRNFVGIAARDVAHPPRIIERTGMAVLVSVVAAAIAGIYWFMRPKAKRSTAETKRG
jgi:uncharacterized protein YigE (DUF2233 family)